MKRKTIPVLCFILVAAVFGTRPTSLSADTIVPVSESTRQMMSDEFNKNILKRQSTVAPVVGDGVDIYEKEGRQIADQIQLYTDNEDLNYTIASGDTLTISYLDRDQINRAAYKVSQSGEIYVPLIGSIKVAGLNRRQARERVEIMAKQYIREPNVRISVNTDGRLMVFGAVVAPGLYDLKGGKLSVMEVILMAGGFIRQTAELSSVVVVRGPVEKPVILKLNLKKMVTRGDRTDDVPVKPGDFIYVPTSFISNLEQFWNTAYGYLMQWYGLGGGAPIRSLHKQ